MPYFLNGLKLYQRSTTDTNLQISPKFLHFSPEREKTESLGTAESQVWVSNLNVKARKTTEHKLHKIWWSLKFLQTFRKTSTPLTGCTICYQWPHSILKSFWSYWNVVFCKERLFLHNDRPSVLGIGKLGNAGKRITSIETTKAHL